MKSRPVGMNVGSAMGSPAEGAGEEDLRGLPPDAAQLVACFRMMPPKEAAMLIAKLKDVVRTGSPTTAADAARVESEVAELSDCLKMMGNSAAAISKLRGYAGLGPEAALPGQSDQFIPSSSSGATGSADVGLGSVYPAADASSSGAAAPGVVQWDQPNRG